MVFFLHKLGIVHVAFGRDRNRVQYLTIKWDTNIHLKKHSCGLNYFDCRDISSSEPNINLTREIIREKALSYCLLLPYHKKNYNFNKKFTIITSDWKTLSEVGTIDTPTLSRFLFIDASL